MLLFWLKMNRWSNETKCILDGQIRSIFVRKQSENKLLHNRFPIVLAGVVCADEQRIIGDNVLKGQFRRHFRLVICWRTPHKIMIHCYNCSLFLPTSSPLDADGKSKTHSSNREQTKKNAYFGSE